MERGARRSPARSPGPVGVGARVAVGPILGEAACDDVPHLGRDGLRQRRVRQLDDPGQEGRVALGLEGEAAGQHLVEDDAQRPDVGPRIDAALAALAALAQSLLGAHVGGRAEQLLAAERGRARGGADPEVEELGHHAARGAARQEHVLGLEIAVDDAGRVRRGEAPADLGGDGERVSGCGVPRGCAGPGTRLRAAPSPGRARPGRRRPRPRCRPRWGGAAGRRCRLLAEEEVARRLGRSALALAGRADLQRQLPAEQLVAGRPHRPHGAGADAAQEPVASGDQVSLSQGSTPEIVTDRAR